MVSRAGSAALGTQADFHLITVLTASFFDDSDSKTSAAALFLPPRGTLPYITRIFMQSFTVYTIAILLPYTRTVPKVVGLALFGLATWWIGEWNEVARLRPRRD